MCGSYSVYGCLALRFIFFCNSVSHFFFFPNAPSLLEKSYYLEYPTVWIWLIASLKCCLAYSSLYYVN